MEKKKGGGEEILEGRKRSKEKREKVEDYFEEWCMYI